MNIYAGPHSAIGADPAMIAAAELHPTFLDTMQGVMGWVGHTPGSRAEIAYDGDSLAVRAFLPDDPRPHPVVFAMPVKALLAFTTIRETIQCNQVLPLAALAEIDETA